MMLEARNLACMKGERLLFRNLNLHIQAGGLLRVMGPNGAGKTSLLRILCSLAVPEAGQVLWNGQDIHARAGREVFAPSVLYLGHAPMIHGLLTPLENLQLLCAADAQPADADICAAALRAMGLEAALALPCRVLSAGQRRRVALARLHASRAACGQNALARPLWVLDEPFTALDVASVEQLAQTITAHCAAGGMAIFVSHQEAPFGLPAQTLTLGGTA